MSFDFLALLASIGFGVSEILAGTRSLGCCTNCLDNAADKHAYLQKVQDVTAKATQKNSMDTYSSSSSNTTSHVLAVLVYLSSCVCLIFSGHLSYLFMAMILGGLGVAVAAWHLVLPTYIQEHRYFGSLSLKILGGLIHLAGVWTVFWTYIWNTASAYDDPIFFGQEIGHFVPSTFYYAGLVLMPLYFCPPNYERGQLRHQFWEGLFILIAGVIYFIIFRTAHYLQPGDEMSAPNWDHELLGLVWAGSGGIGVLNAYQRKRTSVHIAFPALWVFFSMMTHSMSETHTEEMGLNMIEMTTWMKLHQLHGMAFGLGALCRLLYRIPEAVFFFFLGATIFCFSAQWLVKYLVAFFTDPNYPDIPVDHIIALVTVTLSVVLYPLHAGALYQLRKPFDRMFGETDEADPSEFMEGMGRPSRVGFAPLNGSSNGVVDGSLDADDANDLELQTNGLRPTSYNDEAVLA